MEELVNLGTGSVALISFGDDAAHGVGERQFDGRLGA
jgi:hypothetical protein